MQVRTLATVSSDGNTDVRIPTQNYGRHPEMVLQVNVTGTITIQILGSLDGVAYVEMLAASAVDALSAVALVPYLRITASGTSGGSAVVKVGTGAGPYA